MSDRRTVALNGPDLRLRLDGLAREISAEPFDVAIIVATGGCFFAVDLLRHLLAIYCVNPRVHTVMASSYGDARVSSNSVAIYGLADLPLAGARVLVIDDVLDTGATWAALRARIQRLGARACDLAVAVDKGIAPERARYALHVGHTGFLVGYGLDREGRDRAATEIFEITGG